MQVVFHTFFQSSLNAKHGSISKYLAYIRGSVERHAPLLRLLEEYIRLHEDNPSRYRLRCRQDLDAVETVASHEA
eukprot:9712323-Prorocentrum_lima.AAC.1